MPSPPMVSVATSRLAMRWTALPPSLQKKARAGRNDRPRTPQSTTSSSSSGLKSAIGQRKGAHQARLFAGRSGGLARTNAYGVHAAIERHTQHRQPAAIEIITVGRIHEPAGGPIDCAVEDVIGRSCPFPLLLALAYVWTFLLERAPQPDHHDAGVRHRSQSGTALQHRTDPGHHRRALIRLRWGLVSLARR